MARKVTTGNFAVPAEIMALKPKELNCTVKVIKTFSKTTGTEIVHYYVYEVKECKDDYQIVPKSPWLQPWG
jgi:hypothetical protein